MIHNTFKHLPYFFVLALLCIQTAYASWSEFIPQPLVKSDFDLMKGVTHTQFNGQPAGTELSWENPKTKLKGKVVLVKNFGLGNKQCREIKHIITFPNGEIVQFLGTLCKNKKKRWESLPFTFPAYEDNGQTKPE